MTLTKRLFGRLKGLSLVPSHLMLRPHLNHVEGVLSLEDQGRDAEQEKEQLVSTLGWEFNALNLKLQEGCFLDYTVF